MLKPTHKELTQQEKVTYYEEQIKRLSPPRTYTDRILVRIYRDMVDKYLKQPG